MTSIQSTYFLMYCPCCEIEWTNFVELENHCLRSYFGGKKITCRQPNCQEKFDTMQEYLDHVKEEHLVKKARIFTVGSPAMVEVDLEGGPQEDLINRNPTTDTESDERLTNARMPFITPDRYAEHVNQLPLPYYIITSLTTMEKSECLGFCGGICFIVLVALFCLSWAALWYYYEEDAEDILNRTKNILNQTQF